MEIRIPGRRLDKMMAWTSVKIEAYGNGHRLRDRGEK